MSKITLLSVVALTFFGGFLTTVGAEEAESDEVVQRLAGLEFRSFVELQNDALFSLYDPLFERSVWMSLDVPVQGLRVVSFDRENEQLVVALEDFERTMGLANVLISTEERKTESSSPSPSSGSPRTGTDRERLVAYLDEAREKSGRFNDLSEQMILSLRDFRALSREFSDLERGDPDHRMLTGLKVKLGREMDDIRGLMREEFLRMVDNGMIANVSERDRMLFPGHMQSLLFAEENKREEQDSRPESE
ncbi:MAG: hypothetical protein JJT75_06640 [Opitutales bacterium]|nr:hypothetical protein [Opitutales bacterium]MCH8541780.1 hypothetical protein [Opitutales bacterium]